MNQLRAVLFDKDGTLVDFHRTWDPAVGAALRAACPDARSLAAAAEALGFDLTSGRVEPGSPFIAESTDVVLSLVEPHLDPSVFVSTATEASMETVVAAVGVPAMLHRLRAGQVALAVVTNDWERVARRQLETLGWTDLFDAVVGSDSGFGAKPEPGMVHGALDLLGVTPADALLVGDAIHDVLAGHRAGVSTALITNGQVPHPQAAALADAVVHTVADLDLG